MTRAMRCIMLGCFLAVIVSSFAVDARLALAQEQKGYVPLAPIETGTPSLDFTGCSPEEVSGGLCLGKYLRTLYNIGIAIAGLFAVLSIVRGGFTLLWTDSILGHSEAKGILLRAVGGLLIVYSSYILMNVISPALGRDLDLNLKFASTKRITAIKDARLNQSLTDAQFEQLTTAVARRDKELQKIAKELRAEADELEKKAAASTDPEQKAKYLREAAAKRQEAATTDFDRVKEGVKDTTIGEILKADTRTEVAAVVAKTTGTNGDIQKIHETYIKQRTNLATSPAQALASYKSEMQEVSGIHKQLASKIIEHPPNNPGRAEVVDEAALTQQLSEQINAILNEKKDQKSAVLSFNQANPTFGKEVTAQLQAIETVADRAVCDIKNDCRKTHDYMKTKCENLRPDIKCTY